jgi:hypothetical protein
LRSITDFLRSITVEISNCSIAPIVSLVIKELGGASQLKFQKPGN